MKEQLIELAKEKGFESNILAFNLKLLISTDKNEINRLYYYLWLCEIQKWLRENHSIFVKIEPYHREVIDEGYNIAFLYEVITLKRNGSIELHNANDRFVTYEKALEEGLFEALKLIKEQP